MKVGSQTERAGVRAKGGKVATCSQGVVSRSLWPLSTPSLSFAPSCELVERAIR